MSNKFNLGGSRRGPKTEAELKKGVVAHRVKDRYSTLWPLLLILGTLIATTSRDLITFRSLKRDVIRQNASQQALLTQSGKELDLVNALRDELLKLSYSDQVAARILIDYFPGVAPTRVSGPDTSGLPASSPNPTDPTTPAK